MSREFIYDNIIKLLYLNYLMFIRFIFCYIKSSVLKVKKYNLLIIYNKKM
jgi:hypothetical protein